MKNKLLLMVLILIIFQGALSSQTLALRGDFYLRGASYFSKSISLDLKDSPLGDAISQISNLTGIKFYYSSDIIPVHKVISIKIENEAVADALDKIFTSRGFSWIPVSFDKVVLTLSEVQQQERGNIRGKITDEGGNPIPFANVLVVGTTQGAAANVKGEYFIENITPGTYVLRVSAVGYKTKTAEVTVKPGETATANFILSIDVLRMGEVVVTGSFIPLSKMESSLAISTLSPRELTISNPRSTTEMLRYIPGFTRVESSGGEVNQNISIRGILGVEYVMFMEDGVPVYPTMHTFFMNADNLFRPDENIERVEVIRGGSSSLFGSNTPGAIINFINKAGGPELSGTLKATAGTQGLARIDFNVNGPLGDKWRFNFGGFYRYDRGVRFPGYPGIRGGQLKASVTRLLDNGYVRASLKIIDDRNQFILPLPFQNPTDPKRGKP
jgi:iron complex outermembrane receptor protein